MSDTCFKCGLPIEQDLEQPELPLEPRFLLPGHIEIFRGQALHIKCRTELVNSHELTNNPAIELKLRVGECNCKMHNFSLRADEIFKVVDHLRKHGSDYELPARLEIYLTAVLAEYQHLYAICENKACGRAVSRHRAIEGRLTMDVEYPGWQNQVVDKFKRFGEGRVLHMFCSTQCDAAYAAIRKAEIDAEEAARKKKDTFGALVDKLTAHAAKSPEKLKKMREEFKAMGLTDAEIDTILGIE